MAASVGGAGSKGERLYDRAAARLPSMWKFDGDEPARKRWMPAHRSIRGTTDAESVRTLIDKPEHLIVKDAAVEAVSFHGTSTVRVASRSVRVVDVVGAGDAFAAGWLSGCYAAAQVLASPSDLAPLPEAGTVIAMLEDASLSHARTGD